MNKDSFRISYDSRVGKMNFWVDTDTDTDKIEQIKKTLKCIFKPIVYTSYFLFFLLKIT